MAKKKVIVELKPTRAQLAGTTARNWLKSIMSGIMQRKLRRAVRPDNAAIYGVIHRLGKVFPNVNLISIWIIRFPDGTGALASNVGSGPKLPTGQVLFGKPFWKTRREAYSVEAQDVWSCRNVGNEKKVTKSTCKKSGIDIVW